MSVFVVWPYSLLMILEKLHLEGTLQCEGCPLSVSIRIYFYFIFVWYLQSVQGLDWNLFYYRISMDSIEWWYNDHLKIWIPVKLFLETSLTKCFLAFEAKCTEHKKKKTVSKLDVFFSILYNLLCTSFACILLLGLVQAMKSKTSITLSLYSLQVPWYEKKSAAHWWLLADSTMFNVSSHTIHREQSENLSSLGPFCILTWQEIYHRLGVKSIFILFFKLLLKLQSKWYHS